MKRFISYDLDGRYDEFVEKLRQEEFRVEDERVCSPKIGSAFILGSFNKGYFFVIPTERMNKVEVSERSRLLKIADDFNFKP
ncbi:MAG: hypothetical protein Q7S06_02775 [Nanoarchaeota archaeon]|nr:hypothetical protein [Nanoarchaeota archaeon]